MLLGESMTLVGPLWDSLRAKLHLLPEYYEFFLWLLDYTDIFGLQELVSIQS